MTKPREKTREELTAEIEVTNKSLRQLKARISKLQNWLKEESRVNPQERLQYLAILSFIFQNQELLCY